MQSLPNPIVGLIVQKVPFKDARRLIAIKAIGDIVLDAHFKNFIKLCFFVPRHLMNMGTDMSIAVEVRPACECALLRLFQRATRQSTYMTQAQCVLNTIALLLYNTFEHEIRKHWQIFNRCEVTSIRCAVSWPDLLTSIEDYLIEIDSMVCNRLLCVPKCMETFERILYIGIIERVLWIDPYLCQLQMREVGYESVKKYIR